MAQKRLQKFKTIVDIPVDAKLLKANSQLLELYVNIQKSEFAITGQGLNNQLLPKSTHQRYIDHILDDAEDMR